MIGPYFTFRELNYIEMKVEEYNSISSVSEISFSEKKFDKFDMREALELCQGMNGVAELVWEIRD